jgi:YfiR/HmsC-like
MPLHHTSHELRRRATGILLFLMTGATLHGQGEKPPEYEVKAVYLLNFAKFVQWPAEARVREDNVFTICVLGDDPFGSILDRTLAGETLDGKPAAIRRIRRVRATDGCRMVFIGASEKSRLGEILGALNERSVLTVSDLDDFAERGGMIQLVLDEDRVRFEVNLTAATRARLALSSELLKVARAVRRNSSGMRRNPVMVAGAPRVAAAGSEASLLRRIPAGEERCSG